MSSQNPDLASPAAEEEAGPHQRTELEVEVAVGEEQLQLLGSEEGQAAAEEEEERRWSQA